VCCIQSRSSRGTLRSPAAYRSLLAHGIRSSARAMTNDGRIVANFSFGVRPCRASRSVRRCTDVGGMRLRVCGARVVLDKICLVKFDTGMALRPGMHSLGGGVLSFMRGAVLLFNDFSDFSTRAVTEASRGQHWQGCGGGQAIVTTTVRVRVAMRVRSGTVAAFLCE
jgi:hypothetical protein